jgi:hypothetical protein
LRDQSFIAGGTGNAEAVEGDVPDQFFPLRLRQIVGDLAGNPGVLKHRGQFLRARLGRLLKLAEHDQAVVQVMDDARFEAVEANEAEAAENLFRREEPGQLFGVAQAVLECDDDRVRANQRRQQFGKLVVGGGFERNQYHVAAADFLRHPGATRLNVKIAFDAADGHAF